MLTSPRTSQASCFDARGMTTITLHLGNFQPAQTGEFSTGVDTDRTFSARKLSKAGLL